MGIFSNSSSFDQVVEKATNETNTKEDWSLIMDVCDKVSTSPSPKDCLKSIVKRLNNPDPHVILQALTLLDACVSNCGLPFHLEIASREFEQEFKKFVSRTTEKTIRDKAFHCLQKWATTEFSKDPQLDLIVSLYHKYKSSGYEFPNPDGSSPSKGSGSGRKGGHHNHHHHKSSKDQTNSSSTSTAQQEADDLAKAIELSLKETKNTPLKSLYPSTGGLFGPSSSGPSAVTISEPRKVRALYDFIADSDDELTFYSGEIVHIVNDTDPNWWQGSNQRGTGLFPSNFVTADLNVETTRFENTTKKQVQFSEEVEVNTVESEPEQAEINEEKIDKTLAMLHEADPTGQMLDPVELSALEDQVQQMGPLIDQGLEKIDRRHAQLTRLGSELVEALNMYHNLMRDPMNPPSAAMGIPSMPGPPLSLPHLHHQQQLQQQQQQSFGPPPPQTMSLPNTQISHQNVSNYQPNPMPPIPHPQQQQQQQPPFHGGYSNFDPNSSDPRPPYSAPPTAIYTMAPPPQIANQPLQHQPHYGN